MSAPKSVVKLKKKNKNVEVEYVSNVDAAQYYIFELSRAALRDVAKFIKKKATTEFYNIFNKRTGGSGSSAAIETNIWSSAKTKFPRVDIGLKPKGSKSFQHWFFYQELGSSKIPKHGILTKTVNDNIAEIVKIESQYLSGLSGEAEALASQIDEGDIENAD